MTRLGRMRRPEYLAPGMSEGHDSPLYDANYGRLVTLNTTMTAGGLQIQPTTLIADVHRGQNEWMVTLSPPMRADSLFVPWTSTFDATTSPPVSGTNFNAPVLPTLGLQCLLRWGIGGATFYSAFDYPYNGAVFGLAAETVNLDVSTKPGQTAIDYASPGAVPALAAGMTEGTPANPTPLRWTDINGTVAASAGSSTYWPVRPFARTLALYCPQANANSAWELVWVNAGGTAVYQLEWLATAQGFQLLFDVPSSAVAFSLTQSGADPQAVQPVWEISFA